MYEPAFVVIADPLKIRLTELCNKLIVKETENVSYIYKEGVSHITAFNDRYENCSLIHKPATPCSAASLEITVPEMRVVFTVLSEQEAKEVYESFTADWTPSLDETLNYSAAERELHPVSTTYDESGVPLYDILFHRKRLKRGITVKLTGYNGDTDNYLLYDDDKLIAACVYWRSTILKGYEDIIPKDYHVV